MSLFKSFYSNNNTNSNKTNSSNNNVNKNVNKKITNALKIPSDKYVFYDKYLENVPVDVKKHFKEPIGLYDPYGNNINPLTGEPYKNVWANTKEISYNSGNCIGLKVPKTYKNWALIWTTLPLFKISGEIINSIRDNSITLIKAGTGTGKSFLAGRICSQAFNFQKKILMTLPKKILAKETAETTAITNDVVLGEEVGYFYKGERNIDKNNKETKIIFTTVGSLIRRLTGEDPELKEYSCIIVDETHERSVETDLLILFLKKALQIRKDLKVVFISATVDVNLFKNYFSGNSFNVIDMGEKTTFTIKDIYEKEKPKDWQKTACEKTIDILKSGEKGDILIFIKAKSDGNKISDYIRQDLKKLNKKENPFMVILASGVPKSDVDYATKEFDYLTHPEMEPNNPYTRKIVFATNVAESSLTVKGAVFVIDCGLELEDIYFPLKNANALLEKNIAKSAVKQRRGRVGRTKDGICYHLYSEKEMEKFNDYPLPSIQKSDLTMDILDLMRIDYIKNVSDVKNVLNEMISPPEQKFIDSALLNLYSMEAISSKDNDGKINELGLAISGFSGLSIQMSRAIIASYYYHCKYEVIPIVVILGLLNGRIEGLYSRYRPNKRNKLTNSQLKKEEAAFNKKQHRFDSSYGDFLTIHNVYTEFRNFMKLPKNYNITVKVNNNSLNGGSIFNNKNNIINNQTNTGNSVDISILTKKTYKDGLNWCIENGFDTRIFINKRDTRNWDRVGSEARQIDRTLMKIVQPANLRNKNFKSYKNDGGNMSKKNTMIEAKNEKMINKTIDPENKINQKDTFGVEEKVEEIIQSGGYIQYAGYNKKDYEAKFFHSVVKFQEKDKNILMSLAHGLYINYAKHVNSYKYITCFPLEKTICLPDPKTTLSLKVKPNVLLYNELFMMREGQTELKLNFITKIPTVILDDIKKYYQKYIEDCFKKQNLVINKNKHTDKHKDTHKGKKKTYKKTSYTKKSYKKK
jgi:HrpA-like RNA helicase